jgi:hypothetical protein
MKVLSFIVMRHAHSALLKWVTEVTRAVVSG